MAEDAQPPTAAAFDPDKFRQTTRAQWESAAEAWDRWSPLLARWLGPATEAMLDVAGVGPGRTRARHRRRRRRTDARRRAPRRLRRATCSPPTSRPPSCATPAAAAAQAGLANVETRELDGERHDLLPAASFDAAISRVGLIYFPDQQRALAGIRHALRPGGRFAAVVYSTPEQAIPSSPCRSASSAGARSCRRRLPGQPGPFSLGGEGVLARTLEQAGFRDVEVRKVDSPVRLPTAAECVRFERESFGALHQMMAGMSDGERADTWREIEEALAPLRNRRKALSGRARCWSGRARAEWNKAPRHSPFR